MPRAFTLGFPRVRWAYSLQTKQRRTAKEKNSADAPTGMLYSSIESIADRGDGVVWLGFDDTKAEEELTEEPFQGQFARSEQTPLS